MEPTTTTWQQNHVVPTSTLRLNDAARDTAGAAHRRPPGAIERHRLATTFHVRPPLLALEAADTQQGLDRRDSEPGAGGLLAGELLVHDGVLAEPLRQAAVQLPGRLQERQERPEGG